MSECYMGSFTVEGSRNVPIILGVCIVSEAQVMFQLSLVCVQCLKLE